MRNGISILVGLGILVCFIGLRIFDPIPVKEIRETYFDTLQRLSPRQPVPVPVRVVDIDEQSLAEFGQWPWSRSKMAELTNRLGDLGAAVVVFDFLFAEPDRLSPSRILESSGLETSPETAELLAELNAIDTDALFATALQITPSVLGISDAGQDGPPPMPPKGGIVRVNGASSDGLFTLRSMTGLVGSLGAVAAGTGIVNVSPLDGRGIVREVPLMWSSDAGVHNSLAVEALRVALGESSTVMFGDGTPNGLDLVGLAEFQIPTTADGQFRVYYRKDTSDLVVSATRILTGAEDDHLRQKIEGNVIFVGTSAAGLLDLHGSPLGITVPGVVIHAQILEQILAGQFLERSDYSSGIEIIELAGICLLMTALLSFFGPALSLLIGALASAALAWNSWVGFTQNGLLVDITFPLIGGFVTFALVAFLQYVFSDTERRAIRRSFSKYVSADVLAQIEDNHHNLELGGELRDVTIMFCDIRDFTPLSETMSAPEMVALLNTLFTDLSDEILAQKGTIDKFIGDSIMAFWNAPIDHPEPICAAQRAAMGMRRRLADFNLERAQNGADPIEISIGIASGEACVGNIGSNERFDYSVIGETVNIAARVEAASRDIGFDVVMLASPENCAEHATLSAGFHDLKGVSVPVEICILVGDETLANSPAFKDLKKDHLSLIDLTLQDPQSIRTGIAKIAKQAMAIDPSLVPFYRALETHLVQEIDANQ